MKKQTEQLILDIRRGKYSTSEAVERLLSFSVIDRIPIDVVKIANDHGFTVYEAPLKEGISGALVDIDTPFYKNENRAIFVSVKDNHTRQMFMVAHIFAHFCLHGSDSEDYYRKEINNKNYIGDLKVYEEEKAADNFAACLLMPASLFTNYFSYTIRKHEDASEEFIIRDMCKQFHVEQGDVLRRLDKLGIIFKSKEFWLNTK